MLVCNRCGRIIDDSDLSITYQHHGFTSLGDSYSEAVADNCSCGGEFVEATKCAVCGEWFDNSDLAGVCECCIEKHETVSEALEIGKENLHVVEGINGFVASCLSVEQINKILCKWVEENFTDHSKEVVKYCEEDKAYYSDWIAEKYGD